MDVLLKNGDTVLDHRGRPVMVSGEDELLQRAAIRLTVRRGSLAHDPDFGSRLFLVRTGNREARDRQALTAVREALAPMKEIAVRSVRTVYDPAAQRLMVDVRIASGPRPYTLEVCV